MADHVVNLKLVKQIEKHPCLYDFKLCAYSCRDTTKKAWNEIGKEVGLSGAECKVKWKNIRAVFSRHLSSTQEPSGKFKKPYYLADAMKFALPFIKKLVPANKKFEKLSAGTYDESESEVEEVPLTSNENAFPAISPQRLPSPRSVSPLSVEYQPSSPNCQLKQSKKRVHGDDDSDNYTWDSAAFINNKKGKPNEDRDYVMIQEANKMFLLSLLPDLREMSINQLRKFKKKVIALIDEILETTPNIENCGTIPVLHAANNIASTSTQSNEIDDPSSYITTSDDFIIVKNEINY